MVELCKCGCREQANTKSGFKKGHWNRLKDWSGENNPFFNKHHTQETREKLSKVNTGRTHTAESKLLMSIANKGKKLSPTHKLNLSRSKKGKKFTEEHKKNLSLSWNKDKHFTIETRNKISNTITKRWKDIDFIESHISYLREVKPNKKESLLIQILNELYPNKWEYTGDFSILIGKLSPDFMYINDSLNGNSKIIELFGDYWHKNEDPKDRIDLFMSYSFTDILIIWEHELKDINKLKQTIINFCDKK